MSKFIFALLVLLCMAVPALADEELDHQQMLYKAINGDAVVFAALQKAAETQDAKAEYDLGYVYSFYQLDCLSAVMWLKKSGEQGYFKAQALMESLYANGCGHQGEVPVNLEESYYWQLLSERTFREYPNLFGPAPSSDQVPIVSMQGDTWQSRYEKHLTPEQITSVKARVANWKLMRPPTADAKP